MRMILVGDSNVSTVRPKLSFQAERYSGSTLANVWGRIDRVLQSWFDKSDEPYAIFVMAGQNDLMKLPSQVVRRPKKSPRQLNSKNPKWVISALQKMIPNICQRYPKAIFVQLSIPYPPKYLEPRWTERVIDPDVPLEFRPFNRPNQIVCSLHNPWRFS